MQDYLKIKNKHVLVTGATSGIGRQTAILLSEYGAKVTIVGRREEKLKETLSMINGREHRSVCFDLADTNAIEPILNDIIKREGAFDGYVQCAGINKDRPLNSVKPERIHEMMLTNFYSFYEIVRVISRKGRFNPGLSIVGVSSTAAECGVASQTAYSASKAAMNGTMRAMARELALKKIRVNTVLPGPTDTEMYRDYLSLKAEVKQPDAVKISYARNYLGMNDPVDVANAIIFLLSPVSRKVTGIQLPVDGGYTSC